VIQDFSFPFRRAFARFALGWMLAAPGFMPAMQAHAAKDEVTLNFVNTDIEAVAAAIGQVTKRNFLIDPRVKGTVNIVSSQPVPASALYDIFLSALRLQGFAAVEANGVTKIMLEADAKMHLGSVGARNGSRGDRLQTQVFVLKYASANQLVPVLRPIISPANTIAAYPSNNSLVITDYAENLRRVDRIIDALDRPSAGEPVVIPLRYASAADVTQTMNRLLAEGSGPPGAPGTDSATRVVIVPDLRTNSIVVRSENPERIARVQSLARQLDAPTGAAGNIHVIYLKNAEATRVAQVLRSILSGDAGAQPAAPLSSAANGPGSPPGIPPPNLSQNASAATGGGGIVADPASNAVIISAPDAVVAHLKSVIEKLDVRRTQVYVEALIVEISADKSAEFGVQWQFLNDPSGNSTQGFGVQNFGARGTGTNLVDISGRPQDVGRGLAVGVIRGQITLPGIGTIPNIGFLARALAADANTNILGTPNLLTLDNEEAKIVIGQNIPILTGQYATATSTTPTPTPFQTIERRDIGLTLRIRPQISQGGTVKLQIFQEISTLQDQTFSGPITNKRAIESTVLVDDGQFVALGGLIQDSTIVSTEKVPLLGDLPLIGSLFRYDTRKQAKTNLMVFLRPVVMRDSASASGAASERYRQLLGEQEKFKPPARFPLHEMEVPRLPPLPPSAAPASAGPVPRFAPLPAPAPAPVPSSTPGSAPAFEPAPAGY